MELTANLMLMEPPLPTDPPLTETQRTQWGRAVDAVFGAAMRQPSATDALAVLARAIRGVAAQADMSLGDALAFVKTYTEEDALAFHKAWAEVAGALPEPPTKA